MFVACPKCAAKYQIPPEITLKEGQKVQCSACQHIFTFQSKKEPIPNESFVLGVQVPKNPVLAETEVVIHENETVYKKELPDVFKPLNLVSKRPSYAWLWVGGCILFLVICVTMVWFYRDMLKVSYSVPPSYTRHSLPRLNEKVVQKDETDVDIPLFADAIKPSSVPNFQCDAFRLDSVRFRYEATALLIEGIIHNNTDSSQLIPSSVYATAYNYRGQILFQKEIFLSKEILQPYGQKAFYGTYSPAPDGVQWIEVSCKN